MMVKVPQSHAERPEVCGALTCSQVRGRRGSWAPWHHLGSQVPSSPGARSCPRAPGSLSAPRDDKGLSGARPCTAPQDPPAGLGPQEAGAVSPTGIPQLPPKRGSCGSRPCAPVAVRTDPITCGPPSPLPSPASPSPSLADPPCTSSNTHPGAYF